MARQATASQSKSSMSKSEGTTEVAAPAAAPSAKPAKSGLFTRSSRRKASKQGDSQEKQQRQQATTTSDTELNGSTSTFQVSQQALPAQAVADTTATKTNSVSLPTTNDGPVGVNHSRHGSSDASYQRGQDPSSAKQTSSALTTAIAEPVSAAPTTDPATTAIALPFVPTAPAEQATTTAASDHDDQDVDKEKIKHSASQAPGKRKALTPSPGRPRVSFFSRLLHVFVPCIGPPSSTTDSALQPDAASSAAALQEKPSMADKDTISSPSQTAPSSESAQGDTLPAEPSSAATGVTVTPTLGQSVDTKPLIVVPIPSTPPAPAGDKDVIVPPTPSRILPKSETEGVLSGAVQPPGSTGDAARAQGHHHESSADESDGSITEDEDVEDAAEIDEVEDDEDRLIMNGGAGIPTGPVSASFIRFRP